MVSYRVACIGNMTIAAPKQQLATGGDFHHVLETAADGLVCRCTLVRVRSWRVKSTPPNSGKPCGANSHAAVLDRVEL